MKKTISGKKHKMKITVATAPTPTPNSVRLLQSALSAPLQSADFDEDVRDAIVSHYRDDARLYARLSSKT